MSWNGGTDIFDCVVEDLFEVGTGKEDFDYIVYNLYQQLYNQDWDNFCESKYYMDERVMTALGKLDEYEEWLSEQEDQL